ncbi:MAG: ABC transporter ATP-binding protein, partial [Clostridia bacterium]|nr:ABC transporter ATP-binding protein [Clostridia bacterium]
MYEYLPLLIVGAIIGLFSLIFILAYALIKNKKEAIGFDRNMKDGEIAVRLLRYARPHVKDFLIVLLIMLISIAYDLISPLIIGNIQGILKEESFSLDRLFLSVLVYAGILIVSLVSTYLQSIILQKTGQKILSAMRQDLFTHIESLSHGQLHQIPVGKLVTRVTNDTNAISMMFTNILVNMIKNVFVIVGVLGAMLLLNYMLTLMVLCFVPFIVLFTVI